MSRGGDRGNVFEELRSRTQQAVEGGRLAEAEALAEEALTWARSHGSQNQVDQAICNRAALAISLGRGEGELPALRKILVRSGSPANAWLAAYNIARYYEAEKLFGKSLFYARIARDRAKVLGSRDWQASSHNQMGNALLGESSIPEASAEYEQALALLPAEDSLRRAAFLVNLGYCRVLQGRFADGYPLLYQCLAVERRIGSKRYEVLARLDLCFAHLETGRYRHALRQGRTALRLALAEDPEEGTRGVKNALYLLGEACSLSGNAAEAHQYFTRLQRRFFPEADYLPGFLLSVDVRKLVNLHA
jgi:tetratricopeptide (TPR) repeat protein